MLPASVAPVPLGRVPPGACDCCAYDPRPLPPPLACFRDPTRHRRGMVLAVMLIISSPSRSSLLYLVRAVVLASSPFPFFHQHRDLAGWLAPPLTFPPTTSFTLLRFLALRLRPAAVDVDPMSDEADVDATALILRSGSSCAMAAG